MQKKYTTILFDFDGCIADTLPIWLKSFRNIFDEMGIEISDRDIIERAFHRWDERDDLGIVDMDTFAKKLYVQFDALSNTLELHDGFIPTIQSIRENNLKTAVVTSTLRNTIDEKLTQLKLTELFDTTLAWEDTKKNKPDPDPIIEAMKRLSATPEETIMIGDNEVDIVAAQRAGVTSVWYYPLLNEYFYPNNAFASLKPDFTLKSFNELVDLL
ncbi:HAD-IA family hydrolase [Candidatus Woesebacteria bacterium]|nr:HAD-IA family hydrolase [Candidatus Woesebacteria bacterium]